MEARIYAISVLTLAGWLLGLVPVQAAELVRQEAIEEYCRALAEQAGSSGAPKARAISECMQEQQAMALEPEVVSEAPLEDLPPQLLERCYQQVDAWLQEQVEAGNDQQPQYNRLLDRCVENNGKLEF